MTTAYLTDPRYLEHTLQDHPEHAGRLRALYDAFAEAGILPRLRPIAPRPATEDELLRVHSDQYLETLIWSSEQDNIVMFGLDTYALPVSYEIARLSAGASLRAVEAIMNGEAGNALVAARPPGHHAVPHGAMGFCLLANVALAARHAQQRYAVERVLIVDYDVHHGNGTQDIFYNDPSVLYISQHQFPFYPGTGRVEETGRGDGRGATVNVPLGAGHNDASYAAIFEQVVWPVVDRFSPQLVIVSAGFDAHWADPLGGMNLTLPGFAHLTRELVRMAEQYAEGRIMVVMEGGYDLTAIAYGMLNAAYTLLGEQTIADPHGPPQPRRGKPASAPDLAGVLDRVRKVHGLK